MPFVAYVNGEEVARAKTMRGAYAEAKKLKYRTSEIVVSHIAEPGENAIHV